MASASTETVPTVADLLNQLGIPPERILLRPAPGKAKEKDLLRSPRLCELIDGVLVEKTMGWYESRLEVVLIYFLESFLGRTSLGFTLSGTAMIRIHPGQVRLPDVSVFLWSRFPNRILPAGQILDLVPDFAIEILSPSNSAKEMARKRHEYFAGGAKLVWEVDPEKRTVAVFTAPDQSTIVDENGVLDGGDVLPGFSLAVRDWFERAGRRE
jgi:Uma2 family endonuclease